MTTEKTSSAVHLGVHGNKGFFRLHCQILVARSLVQLPQVLPVPDDCSKNGAHPYSAPLESWHTWQLGPRHWHPPIPHTDKAASNCALSADVEIPVTGLDLSGSRFKTAPFPKSVSRREGDNAHHFLKVLAKIQAPAGAERVFPE